MVRDYTSHLTTKPHSAAVDFGDGEAVVMHGADSVQSCLVPRATEVKALFNVTHPQLAIEIGTDNAPTMTGRLRCGCCDEYKPMDAFGKRAGAVVRCGRDFVCKKCRQSVYDSHKRQRLSDILSIK